MQIGDRTLIKAVLPVRENSVMDIVKLRILSNFPYCQYDKAMTRL